MNLDVFFSASPVIIIHTLTAFVALGLGIAMWVRKKGTPSHKMIGRLFVTLMAVVAFTAIFIKGLNGDNFSFIHIFVPVTFFAIGEIFFYVRRGNLKGHKRAAKGLFFGALLIPGFLSFLPGRLMWQVAFGG